MDDRHYIAKLERMLEERKDIINTLITICGDLVEERDKLSDYADRCLRDRVNESELLRMEQERFDALVKERDELVNELADCETYYERMSNYADKCHADNVHTHELLERKSKDFDALFADREDLKNKYELITENFDELLSDYHCLDQRFCTEVRDHQEAQHKIKRLEGMVERRDKKIKDLTVERDIIKGACEDCNYGNELLAENEELKEKVDALVDENKHLRDEVKHLNAIVDGAT